MALMPASIHTPLNHRLLIIYHSFKPDPVSGIGRSLFVVVVFKFNLILLVAIVSSSSSSSLCCGSSRGSYCLQTLRRLQIHHSPYKLVIMLELKAMVGCKEYHGGY